MGTTAQVLVVGGVALVDAAFARLDDLERRWSAVMFTGLHIGAVVPLPHVVGPPTTASHTSCGAWSRPIIIETTAKRPQGAERGVHRRRRAPTRARKRSSWCDAFLSVVLLLILVRVATGAQPRTPRSRAARASSPSPG